MGLTIVKAPAGTSAEVQAAAQSLIGRADAIMVIGDNTAVSALESIIKVAEQNKMPLVAGDPDSVKRGAVAAYGFDYYDLGKQTGAMAAKVLSGTPISDIPSSSPRTCSSPSTRRPPPLRASPSRRTSSTRPSTSTESGSRRLRRSR